MLLFYAFFSMMLMNHLSKSSQVASLFTGKEILPKFLPIIWASHFLFSGLLKIANKSDKITGRVSISLINSLHIWKLQTVSFILLFTASKLKKVLKSYGYFCKWDFPIFTLIFQFNQFLYYKEASNRTPVRTNITNIENIG